MLFWKENLQKKPNVFNSKMLIVLGVNKGPFQKGCSPTKTILQDHTLLIIKNQIPIQFVENTWLKHLVMHLCPRVVFPL
jgi:hypothetical protein